MTQTGEGLRPDPEVLDRPVRRVFTADYKRKILEETDRCEETGQIGSLLRREGLYASYLTTWRRQREEGILSGLNKKRGRKESPANPLTERIAALEKENVRLRQELEKATLIIDVQKKISLLLGVPLENQGVRA
ncbi:MAG: transposase [Magnetococcales bacterium]|nr:transposase [Magnetococcales bacterium]